MICTGAEKHQKVPAGFRLVDAWDHLYADKRHRETWRLMLNMEDQEIRQALKKMFPGVQE